MLLLAACSNGHGLDQSKGEIVYEGQCDESACAGLERPETDCTNTAPRFTCSGQRGACAIRYDCPSPGDPTAAISFSPCADAECGVAPTNEAEAGCKSGQVFTGAACGRQNGASVCAWHPGCYTLGPPIAVNPADLGPSCGWATSEPCPEDKRYCTLMPRETGLEGAYCVADPCATLRCTEPRCSIQSSYPGEVLCGQ